MTRSAAYVTVVDPDAGFVTGGGWFDVNSARASFGFVARYQPDGTPTAHLELHAPDFEFSGDALEWLVLTGNKAVARGTGAVRGSEGTVSYLLVVVPGAKPGSKGDGVRIKVWDASGVMFDNQPGAADDANAVTALWGGNVTIHR